MGANANSLIKNLANDLFNSMKRETKHFFLFLIFSFFFPKTKIYSSEDFSIDFM